MMIAMLETDIDACDGLHLNVRRSTACREHCLSQEPRHAADRCDDEARFDAASVARVYEIDKTSPGAYRPLVVAITSKTSAQRLMAQLAAERGLRSQGSYRTTCHCSVRGDEHISSLLGRLYKKSPDYCADDH